MTDLEIVSEYQQGQRLSRVCWRPVMHDWIMIGYDNQLERYAKPFRSQQAAEDCAEDWVLDPSLFPKDVKI